MTLTRPLSIANIRHVLLALLAIGLVLRMGAGCEALAAVPTTTSAAASHCDTMPATPGKPMKVNLASSALCYALPDAAGTKDSPAKPRALEPIASPIGGLFRLDGAPAPPPPKVA
ncbi:hypothetical protein ACT009_01410 [Sphingomonas sp. Tas61C01]|uniref:hypothetical protein n=1 Tax=Sphingomonas sp. Tas61C01 TaxID=3458297 RepID=UPI00403E8E22